MEQEKLYVRAEMTVTRFTEDMITTACSPGDAACFAAEACADPLIQCSATEQTDLAANLQQFFNEKGACSMYQQACSNAYFDWLDERGPRM